MNQIGASCLPGTSDNNLNNSQPNSEVGDNNLNNSQPNSEVGDVLNFSQK